MADTTRYFFGKADKLKSRKTIDSLFKIGKSFSAYPLKVFWVPQNKDAFLQAAVGVSSRNFKKATDRNRIKRLIREAWRLQKNDIEQKLVTQTKKMSVFILFTGKELPDYKLVFDKTGMIIEKLIKLADEKS